MSRQIESSVIAASLLILFCSSGCDGDDAPANLPPIAKVSSDQQVDVGATVLFSGAGSSDPDGDSITYSWTLKDKPDSSTSEITNAKGVRPSLSVDTHGRFEINLIVNDGTVDSAPATVVVTTNNRPPTAVVSPDQVVHSGDTVMLDGNASFDPDEDELSFLWTVTARPNDSAAQISDPQSATPSFIPDIDGSYSIELVVNDGAENSIPATVVIEAGNFAPTAVAGDNRRVDEGITIQLDGSASSDPENDPLTYLWTVYDRPTGSNASISSPSSVTASFLGDVDGDYIIQLVVNDGFIDSPPSRFKLRYGMNAVPIAVAGNDRSSYTSRRIRLNGADSYDDENDPLTYAWTIRNSPSGSAVAILDANQALAEIRPDVPGNYVIELTVNDGFDSSQPDAIILSIAAVTPDLVLDISAGQNHTCAIIGTGGARCWGADPFGQLGYPGNNGSIGTQSTPAQAGDILLGAVAEQIVSGQNHNCALTDSGKLRCWGESQYGRLGYGNNDNVGMVQPPGAAGDLNLGNLFVLQVSAGGKHSCAVMNNKKLYCWGLNDGGQLGYGNVRDLGDDENPTTSGFVPAGGNVIQVSAGFSHTCALLEGGDVRCWGYNDAGQLGLSDGSRIGDDETPASISPVDLGGPAIQISSGYFHTCAVLTDGRVHCWGSNSNGQLGDSPGVRGMPGSGPGVSLSAPARSVAAGSAHNCAILTTGDVECWGRGGSHLGYRNSSGDISVPSNYGSVNIGGEVLKLALGDQHSCALLDSGRMRCWGEGSLGALGYGNQNDVGDNESPADAGDVPVY